MNLLRPIRKAGQAAFTMVEIALSIGIVAFALVAIIGVLPTGLTVQQDNRQDTIVTQDASVLVEAMRSGSVQLTDYANNLRRMVYISRDSGGNIIQSNYFNPGDLTAAQIVGIFSTPTIESGNVNTVYAEFASHSGPVIERAAPDLAFRYRLSTEVRPFTASRTLTPTLSSNLWELQVTMRWPVLPGSDPGIVNVGNGKKVFRTLVSGRLIRSDAFGTPDTAGIYYFLHPGEFEVVP